MARVHKKRQSARFEPNWSKNNYVGMSWTFMPKRYVVTELDGGFSSRRPDLAQGGDHRHKRVYRVRRVEVWELANSAAPVKLAELARYSKLLHEVEHLAKYARVKHTLLRSKAWVLSRSSKPWWRRWRQPVKPRNACLARRSTKSSRAPSPNRRERRGISRPLHFLSGAESARARSPKGRSRLAHRGLYQGRYPWRRLLGHRRLAFAFPFPCEGTIGELRPLCEILGEQASVRSGPMAKVVYKVVKHENGVGLQGTRHVLGDIPHP